MDMNQFMSLFKGQDIKLPEQTTTNDKVDPSLANLDLSNISQNVIEQVRKEYLSSKEPEKTFEDMKSITPEVLVHIATMAKETDLLKIIRQCKERQDKIEKELFAHRESIKQRYEQQKQSMLAKELIGIKDPEGMKEIERECRQELRRMDLHVLKEMDKQVKYVQQELSKLKVPSFKITNDPKEIKLQQKVLYIIQDML
ncbi:hypothetical protein AB4K20DRAFT_1925035 [Rhizopus microsporus]|uniref:Uncharacterized protein n=2 Tax=Rhizopus TaxID=4842 RepID=A0A1X0RS72_RHIZD|nr:hypothetical protein BCV71DRAFT_267122 [Rhizopus microsporus]